MTLLSTSLGLVAHNDAHASINDDWGVSYSLQNRQAALKQPSPPNAHDRSLTAEMPTAKSPFETVWTQASAAAYVTSAAGVVGPVPKRMMSSIGRSFEPMTILFVLTFDGSGVKKMSLPLLVSTSSHRINETDSGVGHTWQNRQTSLAQPTPPCTQDMSVTRSIPLDASPCETVAEHCRSNAGDVVGGRNVGDTDNAIASHAINEADCVVSKSLQKRQSREKQPSPPISHAWSVMALTPTERSPDDTETLHGSSGCDRDDEVGVRKDGRSAGGS
jgi:hypothetical protein